MSKSIQTRERELLRAQQGVNDRVIKAIERVEERVERIEAGIKELKEPKGVKK